MSLRDDGAYWRERAMELLAIAGKIEDPENKRELLGIAEGYEELADRADDRSVPPRPRGD
jgi:hypothetical protein